MTHIFFCRHGERSGNGSLLPSGLERLHALGSLIRPYILPVQTGAKWWLPRPSIFLTSTTTWAFESILEIRSGDGNVVASDCLFADDEIGENKLAVASTFIAEQMVGKEVVVVVTHAVVTAKLPFAFACNHTRLDIRRNREGRKVVLDYACAIHIDTVGGTWKNINQV